MTKTTFQSCCLAAATALAFLTVSPLSAQSSTKLIPTVKVDGVHYLPRCLEDRSNAVESMILTDHYTVKEYLGARTLSMFLEDNGLEDSGVTEEYVFPKGKVCYSV